MMKLQIRMIMTKMVYNLLPGIGMVGIYLNFICVNNIHKNRTLDSIKQFKISKDDVVIVFCEGDIQNKTSMDKSISHARSINKKPMQNVMFPKTLGINNIYSNNELNLITYATIVYRDIKLPIIDRIRLTTHNIPKQILISFNKKKINPSKNIDSSVISIYNKIDSNIKLIKASRKARIKKRFIHQGITLKETLSFILQIILFSISISMLFKYNLYFWYVIFVIFMYYIYNWLIL